MPPKGGGYGAMNVSRNDSMEQSGRYRNDNYRCGFRQP